ncbi:MAG: hypothetical protein H8E40_08280 [Chloroflexi bacterium]|nr:hypothetical protein [Chloroflexota bacterium]
MPRRRMIDPGFWTNLEVNSLSYQGRMLLLGCMGNADDDGRIEAHPSLLKSRVFIFDNEQTPDTVEALLHQVLDTMKSWHSYNPWLMESYQNADATFLYFPNWKETQRPSHATKSKLPAPPTTPEDSERTSGEPPEDSERTSGDSPSQSSLGQSSLVLGLGQSSAVPEDFAKFDSHDDLTDFLTTTLKKSVSAAAARPGQEVSDALRVNTAVSVLKKCWLDTLGDKMPSPVFDGARKALQEYPMELVAKAFAKGLKYKGGKHKSWKYFQAILEEESQKGGRGPPG